LYRAVEELEADRDGEIGLADLLLDDRGDE